MAGRHIPDDLILKEIILKRLDLMTKTDANRFRAVCKSWRSSIPRIERNPLLLPDTFQIIGDEPFFFLPSESIVYHIAPPSDDPSSPKQRGWLIRLDRDGKLVNPLLQTYYRPFVPPKVLNTLNSLDFRISELAGTYCSVYYGHRNKVVALNPDSPTFLLLKDKKLYHGQRALHDSKGTVKLQIMKNQNSSIPDIDDVIIHQGKFYAVSHVGEIIVADSSGNVKSVTCLPCSVIDSTCYRWKMYLIESVGEVLLVQKQGPMFVPPGDMGDFVLKRNIKFNVCKLDEVEKRWIEMAASDLSDRILFLADDMISFSVSAKDFPGCKGSCIYFSYKRKDAVQIGRKNFSEIGVFNLYNKMAYQLASYPTSANIFMPPQHDGGDD